MRKGNTQNEGELFQVITNYEGRYFVRPIENTLPGGWRFEGKIGTRKECLQYLLELWRIPVSLKHERTFQEHAV